MKTQSKKYEIDMCNGPLFGKIVIFTLPLMASGILQLLFNAADMIVVGRWVGNDALAAVGSTGALINLLVNVFLGLSIGTNVLVARFFGAGRKKELEEMVHTSILTAAICGVALIFIGFFAAPKILLIMGAPREVLSQSVLYVRIYFLAMPAMMIYNFGAAILRAVGDTKRPLYFLTIAGVINVILNILFVIGFHMGVAGVAIPSVISQTVSAVLVIICLVKTDAAYQLSLKKLKIYKDKLFIMMKIGLPAGLQGAIFSISNVLIQSAVNSFGKVAMAGNSAAANLEGFVYTSMNTLHQTAVSFVGQNYGAHNFKRIKRIAWQCLMIVTAVGLLFGNLMYLCGPKLLTLYINTSEATAAEAIGYGMRRLMFICCPYFLCGVMDALVGCLRGMGKSVLPMIVSLTGACAFRVVWIYTVFSQHRSLDTLYVSYPISWAITASVHAGCLIYVYCKKSRKAMQAKS
ncbi:MAG: MATE family efflux transporter [Lachnospiraceae bacterium]